MMLNHLKQKGTQNYAKSSFLRILRLECIDLITKNSRSHIRCVLCVMTQKTHQMENNFSLPLTKEKRKRLKGEFSLTQDWLKSE